MLKKRRFWLYKYIKIIYVFVCIVLQAEKSIKLNTEPYVFQNLHRLKNLKLKLKLQICN